MTKLEEARLLYTPGVAFRSAYSGKIYEVPINPNIEFGSAGDVYISIKNDIILLFNSDGQKWAEIVVVSEPKRDPIKSMLSKAVSDAYNASYHIQGKPETEDKVIRRFETGAVRSDATGRPRPDWVSPYAIEAISMRMVGAQNEFGEANYLLGIPELKCLESLCRHVEELKEALLIEKDPAKAKDIAAAVGFNTTAMLHTMVLKEKGLYKKVYDKEEELVTVTEAKKGANFTDKES